jgi:hypothetical protein
VSLNRRLPNFPHWQAEEEVGEEGPNTVDNNEGDGEVNGEASATVGKDASILQGDRKFGAGKGEVIYKYTDEEAFEE